MGKRILMKRYKEIMRILWGKEDQEANPSDLTIDTAYKTRWIWYHTILGILMLMVNILLTAILIVLAVKL